MDRASSAESPFADSPAATEADTAPRSKRQRVSAACDECRKKKIKCDGFRPVCAPCTRKRGPSGPCNWGSRQHRQRGTSQEDLSQLRHQAVEAVNSSQRPAAPEHTRSHSLQLSGEHTDLANAMMGLIDEEVQGSVNHFGDSSVTGFLHQIKRVIDQQSTPPRLQRPLDFSQRRVQSSTRSDRSRDRRHELDYVLPPRQRANHLLDIYWRLVDSLYPFLDRVEVESLYQRVWSGESIGEDGPVFLSLLNLVFSIACTLDAAIAPERRESAAEVFYQRSRELMDLKLVQRQSLLTVQCFLLVGQYLQSTNDPQQCWNFVGLAIRMAQSLGLDMLSTKAPVPGSPDTETLRRVWHSCVLMDRTLSMTFGRPPMITSQGVTLVPMPVVQQNSSMCPCPTDINGTSPGISDSHFFIESLKLYDIINEALLNLYNSPLEEAPDTDPYMAYFGSLGARGVGLLLDRDRCLCLWSRNIPSHLRPTSDSHNHGPCQRQANVLRFQYLHVRMILYRPVLSRFCARYDNGENSPDDAMPSAIALQCALVCLNTAFQVIELFDSIMEGRDLETLDDLLPTWWYSVFYVYSAATVLVAARLQPAITAEIPEQAITKSWQTAMKIMGRFQKFSSHPKRCSAVLNVLFDQVPQKHLQHARRFHQRRRRVAQKQSHQPQYLERSPSPLQVEPGATASVDAAQFPAPVSQWLEKPVPTSQTNDAWSAVHTFDEEAPMDSRASQNFFSSHPMSLLTDPSASEGIFEMLDLQLGTSDMSWLTTVP